MSYLSSDELKGLARLLAYPIVKSGNLDLVWDLRISLRKLKSIPMDPGLIIPPLPFPISLFLAQELVCYCQTWLERTPYQLYLENPMPDESSAVAALPKIKEQIAKLGEQLNARIPEWPAQLQIIHKTLHEQPECAWRLSDDEMAIVVAAFKANAQVTSFQSAKESKSGKSDPTINSIRAAGRANKGKILTGDDF